jgi:signal transduction histidine kinase
MRSPAGIHEHEPRSTRTGPRRAKDRPVTAQERSAPGRPVALESSDVEAPSRRWRGVFVPLGARLVGLFVVLAVAVAITVLLGFHQMQHAGWREVLHPLVSNYADMIVAEIGMPPDVDRARALTSRLPLHIRIEGPTVNWDSADEPSPELPLAPPPPARDAAAPAPPMRHDVVVLPNGGAPIPLILPPHRSAPPASAPRPPPPHVLALPRASFDPSSMHVVRLLPDGHRVTIGLADLAHEEHTQHVRWVTLALLLLLTAFAYAVVRHMLRPLAALRAGAIRYGQGDFSRPIVPRNRDELGDLAMQINGMAARLRHMLDAKRQLLLAISHELRSPLARARLNAELVDESAERTALLRDLGEMRDLINDLLESERLADMQAGGHAALQTESLSLDDLVRHQLDAQAAAGTVELDLCGGLPPVPLDRVRMRLLLRNLVDNALRHGADPARPPIVATRLGTGADADMLLLSVRDHGPGMDEAQLRHAGDAFYRADAARQRSTGGVGLGLHLCRLVAEAHGGRLTIRNASPGLQVDVALPIPARGGRQD